MELIPDLPDDAPISFYTQGEFNAYEILELRHIHQPLLIWDIRMEITVQIVPSDMCGIITASCATLWLPLDRGLDALFTADP